ncbi:hypothetical protein GQR36_08265 [Enterococcus termitis]
MKKLMRAVLILVGIFALSACSKPTDKKETEATKEARAKITIILKEDDKEFDKKEVEVQKNESLQTVMEKTSK